MHGNPLINVMPVSCWELVLGSWKKQIQRSWEEKKGRQKNKEPGDPGKKYEFRTRGRWRMKRFGGKQNKLQRELSTMVPKYAVFFYFVAPVVCFTLAQLNCDQWPPGKNSHLKCSPWKTMQQSLPAAVCFIQVWMWALDVKKRRVHWQKTDKSHYKNEIKPHTHNCQAN